MNKQKQKKKVVIFVMFFLEIWMKNYKFEVGILLPECLVWSAAV